MTYSLCNINLCKNFDSEKSDGESVGQFHVNAFSLHHGHSNRSVLLDKPANRSTVVYLYTVP